MTAPKNSSTCGGMLGGGACGDPWSSSSPWPKAFATANAVDETSWGLKVSSCAMHWGSRARTMPCVMECRGRTRAKAQKMFARCCACRSMRCATSEELAKKPSWKNPFVAKPQSMLESSWGLKSSNRSRAFSESSRKSRSSWKSAVPKAQAVLAISWQFAAWTMGTICAAMLRKSLAWRCLAVAKAHAVVARQRNPKCWTFFMMCVAAAW
mmetsp:Transcript_30427/g.85811  ORF Transcript_30427/g.85811 Transcript_30427/m.85811 type:complete len:210 (-) Transcript_30427:17-646(-)